MCAPRWIPSGGRFLKSWNRKDMKGMKDMKDAEGIQGLRAPDLNSNNK